uniref:Uncharacterized protein n=1 Tax=uncultured bacterium contig00060 TaxID=1181543 RepID=A0A806KJK4_9BACT|nr:hypothetical protein [uncultured bacterium contig00060]
MDIRINGQAADVTIDHEKTVGEIMAGLQEWLAGMGHRLSGLSIDGQTADPSSLEEFFLREIKNIKVLDIFTSSLAQLYAESLLNLLDDIKEYKSLDHNGKNNYLNNWKEKPEALFAFEQMQDLYNFFENMFSIGNFDADTVYAITEERLREVKDPLSEFTKMESLVKETCTLLIDLPLDIQTGKDSRAAQTIQIFSGIAEKVLRILWQLDIQGYLLIKTDDEKSFTKIVGEFGELVKQLLDAYERNDTVLVGDIAEYEASPRLQELYTDILKNSRQPSAAQGKQ